MTKQDIIRQAAKAAGVTQETTAAVLKGAFEAAADALAVGEPVKLNGCGTFEIKQRKAGTTYNFTTGETMQRPARKTIAFTAAAAMKRRINSTAEGEQ